MTDDNDGTTEDEQGRELGDFGASVGLDAAGEERTSDMTDNEKSGHDVGRSDGETKHNLNESADKIRLKSQIKRGSGTRDQDTHDLKARGETPEEAAENLSETLKELEERDVFERIRDLQFDGGEDA